MNSQIAQVLQHYQLNANDFQTQQQALNTIQQRSQSASGVMDLMQAGNQISGLMVTKIQKLQSDIQADNQLMANCVGQETNAQAHTHDALRTGLRATACFRRQCNESRTGSNDRVQPSTRFAQF